MSNLTIEIKATELTQAILALAGALSGDKVQAQQDTVIAPFIPPVQQQAQAFNPQHQPNTQFAQPVQQQAYAQPVQQQQSQAANLPYVAPVQQAPQMQQPVPQQMPTQQVTYTAEQLAVAATQLVDAGKRNDLVQLLQSFGVSALSLLPKEKYGEFAIALRQMGAKL